MKKTQDDSEHKKERRQERQKTQKRQYIVSKKYSEIKRKSGIIVKTEMKEGRIDRKDGESCGTQK